MTPVVGDIVVACTASGWVWVGILTQVDADGDVWVRGTPHHPVFGLIPGEQPWCTSEPVRYPTPEELAAYNLSKVTQAQ